MQSQSIVIIPEIVKFPNIFVELPPLLITTESDADMFNPPVEVETKAKFFIYQLMIHKFRKKYRTKYKFQNKSLL